jgi:putative peptidoglycan lipid II flippase
MSSPGESTPRGASVAKVAFVIMAGNLLSRVLGLGREQLAAGLYGAGDKIAAFQIADNVHTLVFDLLMSGMLEAALIPVFAGMAAGTAAERLAAKRVAGALTTLALLVVGTLALLGFVFAPAVVTLMTRLGGDSSDHLQTTSDLAVTLVRIIMPAVVFLAIGDILMSLLYALHRPLAPALAPGARNAMIVVAMIVLSSAIGVKSMALGVVVGAAAIVALQLPALKRADALPHLNFDFRQPEVTHVLRLYGPIFLGLIVSTGQVIVDRNLAWRAETDALGAMRYATTLVQFVLGLVAAGFSLASLPALARHFENDDEAAFRATLERALSYVTLLIVPAVLGLAVLSRPAVDLLFRHGAMSDHGARLVVIALLGYLPGHLFAAYDQVLIFAFYARKNTRVPVLVGVAGSAVYLATALALISPFGMLGLVLANSAQFAFHAIAMYWLGSRLFGYRASAVLIRDASRTALAGLAMAAVAFVAWRAVVAGLPSATGGIQGLTVELARAGIPALLGAAIYFLIMRRQRVAEFDALVGSVVAKSRAVLRPAS